MDRTEFLEKFFKMYPSSFTETNVSVWWSVYEKILPASIDFDRLFNDLIMNWHTMGTAPSPHWFRENHMVSSAKQDNKCAALLHAEEIKKDCVPPPPELKAKMAALKEKMGMR